LHSATGKGASSTITLDSEVGTKTAICSRMYHSNAARLLAVVASRIMATRTAALTV
jgi:hypothetical protein